jgi:hypothetical protein
LHTATCTNRYAETGGDWFVLQNVLKSRKIFLNPEEAVRKFKPSEKKNFRNTLSH